MSILDLMFVFYEYHINIQVCKTHYYLQLVFAFISNVSSVKSLCISVVWKKNMFWTLYDLVYYEDDGNFFFFFVILDTVGGRLVQTSDAVQGRLPFLSTKV